jgi:hypothetical protein
MAFDWKTYLLVSRFLEQHAANASNREAFLRSAVSRAYYGAFCYVRNYARDRLGFQPRNNADDHGRLRVRLKKGKLRCISDKLERLREWRNGCDYEDNLSFDPQRVLSLALSEAGSVISSLKPADASLP